MVIKIGNGGLGLGHRETSALDTSLVGNDKDEMVAHRRELLLHSWEQRDADVTVRVDGKLPRFVDRGKGSGEVAKERDVACIFSHVSYLSANRHGRAREQRPRP